jgi:hypothetical protein
MTITRSLRSLATTGPMRTVLLMACMLMAAAPVARGAEGASAPPSPGATPATSAAVSIDSAYAALPQQVTTLTGSLVSVTPGSEPEPGISIGVPIEFTLGHCGLLSPIGIDGSLWQPVGGHDPAGGPIVSDADIGELINATPGSFELRSMDRAEFRSSNGVVVALQRAPGALDYPLCM